MASSTAPTTPDSGTSLPMRRAFTVPARLTRPVNHKPHNNQPEAGLVDMLFTHQSGRIISFSPPSNNSGPTSTSARQREDSSESLIGSLPWVSYTERLVATGPLRIYRVPNMVAYLSSGSILRPILTKSQCWCVDGTTKFVLRVGPNQYYRIELPNTGEEDMEKAEDLKVVLAKVLQYETTPCPFQRSFTVQLPEGPTAPVRKRPWRPPAPAGEPQATVLSAGAESLRPLHTISPLPPSPPDSDPPSPSLSILGDIEVPRLRKHTRNMSEVVTSVDAPIDWAPTKTPDPSKEDGSLTASPNTPEAVYDTDNEVWSEVLEQPVLPQIYFQATPYRRRAPSPLPLPANLFYPTSRASWCHLTTTILQKACSIILGSAVQLAAFMLKIAKKIVKKIAIGVFKGVAFGLGEAGGEAGQTMPGRWDYSDADEERSAAWEIDDYGFPLDCLPSRSTDTFHTGGSWEID